ncbi:hypothetical protein [Bradyrhizobium sp. AZCC 2289]|uniref:hypothetical protein n=1 Tax=Bradyrhizobium sp. AZCC 2289 TaxID=3117026 RepID=UPI002FEF8305
MPVTGGISTDDILIEQGYKLVEDCWESDGRLTYLHSENADRHFLSVLTRSLQSGGWTPNRAKLRSFNHAESGEFIEVEPGGSDASGHLLHRLKAAD